MTRRRIRPPRKADEERNVAGEPGAAGHQARTGATAPTLRDVDRWVAGDGAWYFLGEEGCANALDALIGNSEALLRMRERILERHAQGLQWTQILEQYESLLERWLAQAA